MDDLPSTELPWFLSLQEGPALGQNILKLPHLFISRIIAALVPEFAMDDLPSTELLPWFLSLQ